MKQFKKTFWRGYQKEEVDEYIDFLTEELENLKKETNRVLEKNRDSLAEMKEEMEHERKEKEYLEELIDPEALASYIRVNADPVKSGFHTEVLKEDPVDTPQQHGTPKGGSLFD